MRKVPIIVMAYCAVLLASCGLMTRQGYSGPKRPVSEVGIICREAVDSPVSFTTIEPDISGEYQCYELLPGTYRAKIFYYDVDHVFEKVYSSEEDLVITFQIEAGRKYELRSTCDIEGGHNLNESSDATETVLWAPETVSWGAYVVDVGPYRDKAAQ